MSTTEPPLIEAPPAPEPEPEHHSTRRGLRKLIAFFVVLLVLFGGVGLYVRAQSHGSGPSRPVAIVIPEGATISQIASILAKNKVIKNAWLFRLMARFDDRAKLIKAGTYRMRTGMSYGAALNLLANGPAPDVQRITIPEGKTVKEIAAIIGRKTTLSERAFLSAVTAGTHRLPIMPAGSKNLEGLLFPETYDLAKDETIDGAIQLMLDQFTQSTAGIDFSRAKPLGITSYQAVIVASMVEREAKVPEDRPKIARVIYNRLARHMRLQIDATVQYALLMKTGSYKTSLTFADYKISSPYNTYQIPGLPPAPIASPGLASLDAAVHPAATDALFYVLCDKRGGHAFARTQQEFDHLLSVCRSKQ